MIQALNPKDSAVLVVEDNPDDGVLVARSLETFGIRKVFAVETAEEALNLLRRHTCDVALVDYNLPGMNGLRLLERIRESWPDVRVVLVTGARDEHIAVSAMKAGAADYVTKDDLLTSSIIRTLQSTLRQQIASTEEHRRLALTAGAVDIDAALEETDWLLQPFHDATSHHARGPDHDAPGYGDESLTGLFEAFDRYLRETFRLFPRSAEQEEDGLVRMFLERGSSPDEVIAFYRAALRSLLLENERPPVNAALCIARLFALMVEQYQFRLSVQAASRGAARDQAVTRH
jgi:CheY-like chemotaxis protein